MKSLEVPTKIYGIELWSHNEVYTEKVFYKTAEMAIAEAERLVEAEKKRDIEIRKLCDEDPDFKDIEKPDIKEFVVTIPNTEFNDVIWQAEFGYNAIFVRQYELR